MQQESDSGTILCWWIVEEMRSNLNLRLMYTKPKTNYDAKVNRDVFVLATDALSRENARVIPRLEAGLTSKTSDGVSFASKGLDRGNIGRFP